ncbi:Glycosyltransferase involved in cell wall bisynthesis [Nannocystis exedens]|uniref:Glycosyltransferase involved in cell wall bisynthesis n=1 Tax=Nannocystis exedens TaxID=54 RepID=A0A1I2AZ36_9BACT|nr:glycosyltransferase family 4 protein [Nannocystis exedens]PCC74373.1 glycosyltransferase WbuB [Nannocystis exedens]SFE49215.1 Glycosyltransferase involved in cell wall bisynthesis [Nannocystis exedens]
MRLAYLSHYFPPESNAPAARVHELSRALVRAGHEVHVVTGQPNHPHGKIYPGYRAAEYRRERVDGIEVHRVPTLPAASRGVLRRGLGYMSLPTSQIALGAARLPAVDLVLATSPQILTGVAGLALARLRRVPFVLEVRDLWPDGIVAVGALKPGHPIVRALEVVESTLYRGAAGVVSVTDSFVDHFVARGVARERIAVVKNGIDTALFAADADPAPLRAQLGIPEGALLLLYCGTIGMAQDVGLLARAAALAGPDDDFHVVVVGHGVGLPALVDEIAALGVGRRVHVLPSVPRRDVPGIIAAADVSAVILRDEPTFARYLPSKIFEAMAMRQPILLGVRGEAQRLVEGSGAGLAFAPGDPADALAKLRAFAALGRDGRARMGEAARAHVLAHHDRDRQAEDLGRFLARIARSRS